jgi:histidinol-phosphatase
MDEAPRPPDPATELGAALELALACCDEADVLALGSFRQAIEVEAKPDASFVTAADRAIERAIRTRIRARFGDHALVGEECGEEQGDAERAGGRRWIVDPIDGTHSFMRGVPVFATLIAFEVAGDLAAAVASAPALRRRWVAWRGGGAWALDTGAGHGDLTSATRLHVSGMADLGTAHLLFSSARSLRSDLSPGFDALVDRVWRDRAYGDFWGYMLVAEGAAEIMVERELSLWDVAAPRLIVEEAGGRMTDLVGGSDIPATGVIASNGVLHDTVVTILRGDLAPG